MGAPLMTADDFGMSRWWDEPGVAGAPQTARSDGDGPFPINLLDHADLDSLDDARLRYARRMAADAVDNLIALMDAIDARTEDLEPEAGYDLPEGDDERCASGEVDDEEEPDREDGADAEPSLARPEGCQFETGSDRNLEEDSDFEQTYEDPFWLPGDPLPIGSAAHV